MPLTAEDNDAQAPRTSAKDAAGLCRRTDRRPPKTAPYVGAPYWETGRYERALDYPLADGLVLRTADRLLVSI